MLFLQVPKETYEDTLLHSYNLLKPHSFISTLDNECSLSSEKVHPQLHSHFFSQVDNLQQRSEIFFSVKDK